MRDIGQAQRHRGRPPRRNPKGRALLPRGFVEGLDRITGYGLRPFSCLRGKIASAQMGTSDGMVL
jgi:hypothetical protein